MQKIPTVFQRDPETKLVTPEVTPGCEWCLEGYGYATAKWDGTAVLIRDGRMFKRYTLKDGRVTPDGFELTGPVDPHTGKQPGWVPVDEEDKADRYYREAFDLALPGGTYELIGPKVQGNPHRENRHRLIPHGRMRLSDAPGEVAYGEGRDEGVIVPRTFEQIQEYLDSPNFLLYNLEGIVWWRVDGTKAKIKRRDFGLPWPLKA